jgi:hypothetical protein
LTHSPPLWSTSSNSNAHFRPHLDFHPGEVHSSVHSRHSNYHLQLTRGKRSLTNQFFINTQATTRKRGWWFLIFVPTAIHFAFSLFKRILFESIKENVSWTP